MKINKANFIYFTSFFAIALLSFWLMGHYTEGDLSKYNAAYEKIRYLPMNEAYIQYFGILSSLEFGHFAITWIFSNLGVNKHILISFVNALLAMSFLIYGKNKNASFIVLIPIVFLNFYFLALYTEIERLKFSFLFFLLSMIFFENKKYFYTFAIVSVLTHFQIFIIYGSFFFIYFIKQIKNIFINYRIDWKIFIITIRMLLAILILQDHLVRKLNAYLQGLQFLDLLKKYQMMY